MRTSLLAATTAFLMLGGCASADGVLAGLGGLGGLSSARNTDGYLASAAANDQFEIQAAELAVTQAQRPDVRAFAQRLIHDHGRTMRRLADAALEAGASPPSAALTAAQQRTLSQLQQTPAGSFDDAYLRHQIPAHEAAIRLHHAYALSGEAEPLRRAAASAVATVHQHLSDARRLRRLGGSQAG